MFAGWRARALVITAWVLSALFSMPIIFLYEEKRVQVYVYFWIPKRLKNYWHFITFLLKNNFVNFSNLKNVVFLYFWILVFLRCYKENNVYIISLDVILHTHIVIFLFKEKTLNDKNLKAFANIVLQDMTQCWIDLGSPIQWKIYMSLVSFSLFIAPTLIIGGCYTVIVVTIWSQGAALRQGPTRDTRRASSRGLIPRAKIKTVKMTFVIVFGKI